MSKSNENDGEAGCLVFIVCILLLLTGVGLGVGLGSIFKFSITSTKPITPEIRLEVNNNKIDTLYYYKK